MKLLVTGGAGFIGCNFVRHWLGKHPSDQVIVLDALTYAGRISNLADVKGHPGFSFVKGNITKTWEQRGPNDDLAVNAFDPELAIGWSTTAKRANLSEKDRNAPLLAELIAQGKI